MFFSKKIALDEDTVVLAGATAGIIFRMQEKKFGATPEEQIFPIITRCISEACKSLGINPDSQSHTIINAVASTFAMDQTGLAERITNRFSSGDKDITRDEAQQIWNLTHAGIQGFSRHLKNR